MDDVQESLPIAWTADEPASTLLITELAHSASPDLEPLAAQKQRNKNNDESDDGNSSDSMDGDIKEIETVSPTRSSVSTTTIRSIVADEVEEEIKDDEESKSPSVSSNKSADLSSVSIEDKEYFPIKPDIEPSAKDGLSLELSLKNGKEFIDGPSEGRVHEIYVENSTDDALVEGEFVAHKKQSYLEETKTDSDSRSFTSTEENASVYSKSIVSNLGPKSRLSEPVKKKISGARSILSRNKIQTSKHVLPSPTQSTSTAQMFSGNLRKFDKPRDAANICLSQLDSSNWETTMVGLQSFVRLIRHHPEIVDAHFHTFCVALARQVKNLRSQVSRSACQASAEFFKTHGKQLEQEPDDLAAQLFNRTADTNKFLRADAMGALNSMCDNLSPQKVIQTVLYRGACHQNAVVRTAAAKLCSQIVSRLGYEKVFALNREYRDKLIIAGANFLMEGSLETRNCAKAFFKQLSNYSNYHRVLFEVIPPRTYRNIEKALKSIK